MPIKRIATRIKVTGISPEETLVKEKNLNASTIIREIAKHIQGGGGGQPFFATAGGKNPKGLNDAIEDFRKMLA